MIFTIIGSFLFIGHCRRYGAPPAFYKPAARLGEVEDEIGDLFLELATNEEQLKYPT